MNPMFCMFLRKHLIDIQYRYSTTFLKELLNNVGFNELEILSKELIIEMMGRIVILFLLIKITKSLTAITCYKRNEPYCQVLPNSYYTYSSQTKRIH